MAQLEQRFALQISLSRVADSLEAIAISLEKINMKFAEFLNLQRPPTISIQPLLMSDADLKRVCPSVVGYGEVVVCGFCFLEIEDGDLVIECEHAHLCQGCAPCDQCDLEEKS
jgi:hypothetical protein